MSCLKLWHDLNEMSQFRIFDGGGCILLNPQFSPPVNTKKKIISSSAPSVLNALILTVRMLSGIQGHVAFSSSNVMVSNWGKDAAVSITCALKKHEKIKIQVIQYKESKCHRQLEKSFNTSSVYLKEFMQGKDRRNLSCFGKRKIKNKLRLYPG